MENSKNPYLHSTVKDTQKSFLHLFYDVSSVATLAKTHILVEGAIILIKIISYVIFIDLYHLTTSTLPFHCARKNKCTNTLCNVIPRVKMLIQVQLGQASMSPLVIIKKRIFFHTKSLVF